MPRNAEGLQLSNASSQPSTASAPVPILNPTLFVDALRESSQIGLKPVVQLAQKMGLSPLTISIVVAGSVGAVASAFVLAPGTTLGVLATGSVLGAMRFEKNHHTRAQNFIGQVLFASHIATFGAWQSVIGSTVAAVRNLSQGMIPEERPGLRLSVGVAGFCVGSAVYLGCLPITPWWQIHNLPLVAMTLAAAAEGFTKKYSWATRACFLLSTSMMLPFHIMVSGSWFGIGLNAFNIPNLMHSIWKYDLKPATAEPGSSGVSQ